MKSKVLFLAALAVLVSCAAMAQEEKPAHFKLYGFIRNYTVLDTRAVNGGTHDLYFYMPKGVSLNSEGTDLNAGLNWKSLSLTTRLGVDMSGYKLGPMNVAGKVEADFYSLNGSTAASTIAQLRLRLAYMSLYWDNAGAPQNRLTLTVGQAWHPMAADMPHITNLETGAPFNPFNRSPQMMLSYKAGKFTLTGGVLYLSQYLPTGPNGKSVEYYKNGFPEVYMGVAFKSGGFTGKVGATMINTKPYSTVSELDGTGAVAKDAEGLPKTFKAGGILTAVTPFVFLQYSKNMFQLRAKATLASSGEHMNLLSGYGVSGYDAATRTYSYTPMRDFVSFISFQYGKEFQVLGMAGYMKQLGTTADLLGNSLWINTAADTSIQQAFRVTPTLVWNVGKLTISLEYDFTTAWFGTGARDSRGLYSTGQWISNHRIVNMFKFNF